MIEGKKLRLAGKGEVSPYGGQPGDLYIRSKMIEHPLFQVVNDHDLEVTREVKLTEAILGTAIPIQTLDGGELNLKIPPGTKHKTKMRIPRKGLYGMQGNVCGDLYIIVHVSMPGSLSSEQKKLIADLADSGL